MCDDWRVDTVELYGRRNSLVLTLSGHRAVSPSDVILLMASLRSRIYCSSEFIRWSTSSSNSEKYWRFQSSEPYLSDDILYKVNILAIVNGSLSKIYIYIYIQVLIPWIRIQWFYFFFFGNFYNSSGIFDFFFFTKIDIWDSKRMYFLE